MEMTKILKDDFNTSLIPVIKLTSKSDLKDQIENGDGSRRPHILKPFGMEYLKNGCCLSDQSENQCYRQVCR